jgi:TrmH family RNA methyltransferase
MLTRFRRWSNKPSGPSSFDVAMGLPREPSPKGEGSHRSGRGADPEIITSRKNPLIQDLRDLIRSSNRRIARCVVEGRRALEAAAANRAEIQLVVHTPDAAADPPTAAVLQRLRAIGIRIVTVSAYVFAPLSQVESPQGVLAVARRPREATPSLLEDPHVLLVVLDGLQDPGNVGTILRTAAAAGAAGALIVGPTADPFGPKAIRASAGAVFGVPVRWVATAEDCGEALAAHRVRVLIADPRGDDLDSDTSFARPLALVFGGEGRGAGVAWTRYGTTVRLSMAGTVESLNVAAAAAVLLYRVPPTLGSGDRAER